MESSHSFIDHLLCTRPSAGAGEQLESPGDLSDEFPTLDTLNQDEELGSKTFKKST